MYKTEVFIPRTERLVLLYDADPNFGAAKLIRLGKTVFYE